AGAGLEDIDHEFVIPLALLDFLGGLDDGVGEYFVYQSEIAIGLGGRFLHQTKGANKRGMSAYAGDRIILEGAGGLNAVINLRGNFLGAQRIFFGACCASSQRRHECSWKQKIITIENELSALGSIRFWLSGMIIAQRRVRYLQLSKALKRKFLEDSEN